MHAVEIADGDDRPDQPVEAERSLVAHDDEWMERLADRPWQGVALGAMPL